jgi:tetratricopeptide (TPR) repeat protein
VEAAARLHGLRDALNLLENAQPEQAGQICRRLISQNRADTEALLLLGLAVGMQGQPVAAAPLLNRVANRRHGHAHPCGDLARMLVAQGKATLVEPQYRACLKLTPDDLRLRYGLSEFLRECGDCEAAIELLAPVLLTHPDDAEAHDLMGMALAEAGRFAEAAERFREATVCDPTQAVFWANLGMMLKVEGQFDASLNAYDAALARAPDNRQIRGNRAVACLGAGRFAEARPDEDAILSQPGRSVLPVERLLPPLSVQPDLTGRTVLVVHEEGLGDTLQFMRYLPLLARRGARVVAAVPTTLTALLRTVSGVADVPTGDAPVPQYDFHCSFNGLPRAFETTVETIPCEVPYLEADPALVRHWSARLPTGDALRVGLCWAGQARPWLPGFVALDRRRSTDLTTLAPLRAVPGVRFVSLQKGPAAAQAHEGNLDLLDVMDDVTDFADTAAIVANLDLVISVDTSIVHLAGALGKPVFLLDRYDNCWRWLSGREDSPWYPSLRIFRQERSGKWEPVIARVVTALAAAASRPSRSPEHRDAA